MLYLITTISTHWSSKRNDNKQQESLTIIGSLWVIEVKGTQCTCDNTTLYEGVWSQISHQIWARVIITRLILPIDKGLASVRAGTREPGLLFLSGKDEKTHLVYENGCFVNIHGMR
uniref:Uncharacterized protein n=1 Tax=Helianthus annuus TaxID=4232 RepID=A0A251VPI3_HELAN